MHKQRLKESEEDFIRDVEAGVAEAKAGQLISHADAVKYFRSLGTNNPLMMPAPNKILKPPSAFRSVSSDPDL